MTSPRFSFRARNICICGTPLIANAREVARPSAWGEVTFRRCTACGSFVQSPEIAPDSLAAWYDSDAYQGSSTGGGAGYHNYLADEGARLSEAEQRYEHDLRPYLPQQGRILEIGCATGSLLAVARRHGHEVTGIDLSLRFVEFGRATHGLDLICGDFLDVPPPEHAFDLILIMGTISNLTDAFVQLEHAVSMLKPGGCVLLNLPAADSWVARLYGQRFWMFTPSVNTFYARGGIVKLLERVGLRVVSMKNDVQRPSFGKLAHHLKLAPLTWLVRTLRLGETRLPFGLPLPGIVLVRALKG